MGRITLIPIKDEEIDKVKELCEIYKKNNEIEDPYDKFLEYTLDDAINGLTRPLLIAEMTERKDKVEIVGFSALSTSFIEADYTDLTFKLYKEDDYPYLSAIQIDLFLLIKSVRGKGLGKESFRELLKFIFSLRENLGFRFVVTLSTSNEFSNLVKKFGFGVLKRDIDIEKIQEGILNEYPFEKFSDTNELIEKAKEIGIVKGGVWLFADLFSIKQVIK